MKKAGIRFDEADYVRLYCQDTPSWKLLSPPAQMIYAVVRRKLNSAGLLELGGEQCNLAVTATLGWPESWAKLVGDALEELLKKKWLVYSEIYDSLLDPDFDESEHTPKTTAARKRIERSRRAAQAKIEGLEKAQEIREVNRKANRALEAASRNVTSSSSEVDQGPNAVSRNVTSEFSEKNHQEKMSQNVTPPPLRLVDSNVEDPYPDERRRKAGVEMSRNVTKCHENTEMRTESSPFFLLPSPSTFSPQAAAAAAGGGEDVIENISRVGDDRSALSDTSPETTPRTGAAVLHPQRAAVPEAPAVAEPQGLYRAPVVAESQGSLWATVPEPVPVAAEPQDTRAPADAVPQGLPRAPADAEPQGSHRAPADAVPQGSHWAAVPRPVPADAEPQDTREAPADAVPQGFTQPYAATAHALARKLEPEFRPDPASGFLAEAESLCRRLWSRHLWPNEIDVARRWFEEGYDPAMMVAAIEKKCGMCEGNGQLRLTPPNDAKRKKVENLAWFNGPLRDYRDAEEQRRTENWEIPPPSASPMLPKACLSDDPPDDDAAHYRAELVDLIRKTWNRARPSRGEEETIQEWLNCGVDPGFVAEYLRDPPLVGGEPASYLTAYRVLLLRAWHHREQMQAPARAASIPETDISMQLKRIADALPERLPDRQSFAEAIRTLSGDSETVDRQLAGLEEEVLRALHSSLSAEEEAALAERLESSFAVLEQRLRPGDREAARVRMYCQLLREQFEVPGFSVL